MIHYHGLPITPESACAAIMSGRHAFVSFAHPDQIALAAEICQSFALDNGAFSHWRAGKGRINCAEYYGWVDEWRFHPGFDWAVIPDVIDGSDTDNDELVGQWPFGSNGVPVWHLHESISRLRSLAESWPRIAFCSSGDYATPGDANWWSRMGEAMEAVTRGGRPITKLHGLRMLDVDLFRWLPLASADSTNIARNIGIDSRWRGTYAPANKSGRGIVIADRIEAFNSAQAWDGISQLSINFI
jgi:hypothetical protein